MSQNMALIVPCSSFVQTDMGNKGAMSFGMAEAFTTVKDSVDFLVTTVRPVRSRNSRTRLANAWSL